MSNKKEGSALLTLLMISMVLSIMGGVTTSAILSTTKGNASSREKDDLFYAVESGIELGIALVRKDIKYANSVNLSDRIIQNEIDLKAEILKTNTIHSVD
ncbi:MAG: pilus assembly PilX N-terminal domain-containing protein, partial [Clostridium sp.]